MKTQDVVGRTFLHRYRLGSITFSKFHTRFRMTSHCRVFYNRNLLSRTELGQSA